MRSICSLIAVVLVACGSNAREAGKQPMGVVGDGVAEAVRDEVETLRERYPEPTACELTAALAYGWLCEPIPCTDPAHCTYGSDDLILFDSAFIDVDSTEFDRTADGGFGCEITADDILTAHRTDCESLSLADEIIACALAAQDAHEFTCCYAGTGLLIVDYECD